MDSRKQAAFLWCLLTVFILRVIGQLMVSAGLAPFLPPMDEWQSGLLPYPVLVIFQVLIIIVFCKTCIDFTRGTGFFVESKTWLAKPLLGFSIVYFSAMLTRYAIYMALVPEARWFKGTIPILLHLILALFLFTVSRFQLALRAKSTAETW